MILTNKSVISLQTHKNLKFQSLAVSPKDMARHTLPYLKALYRDFWPLWTSCGTRSEAFNTIGQNKYTGSFYSDIMYLHCINLKKVKERFIFFGLYDFSTKRAEKMKKTCLLNKLAARGAILLGPTCTLLEKM